MISAHFMRIRVCRKPKEPEQNKATRQKPSRLA
jgi:hypothetical protein